MKFKWAMLSVFAMAVSGLVLADDYSTEGTVNAVKTKERKLNITHGPVKGLMDGMTMDFPVLDPAMLEEVKPGMKIKFVLTKDKSGNLVVTDLEPITASAPKK